MQNGHSVPVTSRNRVPVVPSRPMPPSMLPTGLPEAIVSVCRAHPVTVAYLFGSHARGTADAESDIDVAVLADPSISKEERHALKLTLGRALASALPPSAGEIDIVVLQDVPVLLRYNVVRTGLPVFATTLSARRAFEFDTERRYEDERPLLDREADLTLDRILSRAA